ncbi:hypothetical protein K435DRAFT_800408 [Dendrothele bispora CBS 962.96]|uniref:Uncharacterized protein n=1 Tax=Dendrothele bispora (strain CBS 962.96) TaxID=1314807 RepID=A0A4S8LSS2_DENBC|nr:hypothetical protein K435DRAFT_800408 [Dendrothele bispora CBS 962.96]
MIRSTLLGSLIFLSLQTQIPLTEEIEPFTLEGVGDDFEWEEGIEELRKLWTKYSVPGFSAGYLVCSQAIVLAYKTKRLISFDVHNYYEAWGIVYYKIHHQLRHSFITAKLTAKLTSKMVHGQAPIHWHQFTDMNVILIPLHLENSPTTLEARYIVNDGRVMEIIGGGAFEEKDKD